MEAAFLAVGLFPPPTTSTDVFAGLDGAGAGLTADGGEAARVQRVHGNVVGGDVGFELGKRPVGERVGFEEAEGCVDAHEGDFGTAWGLLAAQARDPAGRALQRAAEGLHFADVATGFAGVDGGAEAIDAVAGDELFESAGFGGDDADGAAVAADAVLDGVERLGKVTAGIEREDVDGGARDGDGVEDDLVFEAEAG